MLLYEAPFPEWKAFVAVGLSWFIAQSIKMIQQVIRQRRFNLKWIFDTGGMPSAHSASVASLATAVGLFYGFFSIISLISVAFAIVTMFDAAGVRRAVGKQAKVLNKMTDELYESGQIGETRLKELLGHTPIQVFAGAFIGIVLTLLICA